jgi:hypothetical protein
MQISGVSLALTWPCRLCLLRFLPCVSLCYKLSSFQALGKVSLHLHSQACMFIYSSCGRWSSPLSCAVLLPPPLSQAFLLLLTGWCCCSCQPPCLFTVHVGSGSSPLSCGVFLPLPLLQAFLLLVAGCAPRPCSLQRLSGRQLVYLVPERVPFPQSSALRAPYPLSSVSYCFYCLLLGFSFFLGWRSVCPGGYAALAQVCLWEYRSIVKLTWSASSQAVWVPATGGPGALLVSPFKVKWRFSAPAGGVEGPKLCLFSVIMPAKCVSSVSPRFHYRRLAFRFIPLATILESS